MSALAQTSQQTRRKVPVQLEPWLGEVAPDITDLETRVLHLLIEFGDVGLAWDDLTAEAFPQGSRNHEAVLRVLRALVTRGYGVQCFGGSYRLGGVAPVRQGQHWLPRARDMRNAGASYAEIGRAVCRDISVVHRALNKKPNSPRKSPGKHPYRRGDAHGRCNLRAAARKQATLTGEPVERIYARWSCEAVDKSKIWDQRRAAVSAQEAAP